ncbi:helix-turn-helix transcriptional regulator [Streptomyces sp. H27-D2]|uniref:helix-turn-helix transcriptional regulator n=1 Tax=Streptomyces sp. H27-D2 TaxID=3046304 RepID=UPI002DB972A8|nr:helix-turn-helix domain-containing protein [Streptomyces sp. H27-D2]MEC4019402.1 helix-turn-helix domain-containing protein [Streptomyces sp. H27-D2]
MPSRLLWAPAGKASPTGSDHIRLTRLRRSLTQETLAERVGLDRKTIVRIEAGQTSPLLDHLLLLADALDVPLTQLVAE